MFKSFLATQACTIPHRHRRHCHGRWHSHCYMRRPTTIATGANANSATISTGTCTSSAAIFIGPRKGGHHIIPSTLSKASPRRLLPLSWNTTHWVSGLGWLSWWIGMPQAHRMSHCPLCMSRTCTMLSWGSTMQLLLRWSRKNLSLRFSSLRIH